jgi:hypothetical protein
MVGAAPSWFEVLGRDAALLATAALARFPVDHVEEGAKVEELHRRARAALHALKPTVVDDLLGFKGRHD